MIEIEIVKYDIGDPKKLRHKKMNLLERLLSCIVQSHVCQICGRKEIYSISEWLQISDPVYKDKDGCSVICNLCWDLNENIFGKRSKPRTSSSSG